MPEAPGRLFESGGVRAIIESAETSGSQVRVITQSETRLRLIQGGGGGISGVVKGLLAGVGITILTALKRDAGVAANPARHTAALHYQDWRWTWDDFAEGIQNFVQEMDAAIETKIEPALDPDRADSLPGIVARHEALNRTLFDDRAGHPRGWIWRLGDSIQNVLDRLVDGLAGVDARHDNLLSRLFNTSPGAERGWIWRLGDSIQGVADNVAAQVLRLDGRVDTEAAARRDLERGRITDLETGLGDVRGRQTDDESWLDPVRNVLPVALAIPAFTTLLANVEKLPFMCRWDVDDIGQLFDILLFAFGIGALIEVLREAANTVDELTDLARPFLE